MKQLFLLSASNPRRRIYLWIVILVLLIGVSIFYYFSFQRIYRLEEKFVEFKDLSSKLQAAIEGISEQKIGSPEEEEGLAKEESSEKVEQKGPVFSQEEQKIGEEIKDFKIKSIRTGDHIEFFRIVFDLEKLDGKDLEKIPLATARYLKEEKVIEVEISGLGGDLKTNPAMGQEVKIGDEVVNSYIGEFFPEAQKIKYKIFLKKDTSYLLDHRLNPARIVLDIQK